MLRAEGPDWQRVLGYVESIYRHFEMWSPWTGPDRNGTERMSPSRNSKMDGNAWRPEGPGVFEASPLSLYISLLLIRRTTEAWITHDESGLDGQDCVWSGRSRTFGLDRPLLDLQWNCMRGWRPYTDPLQCFGRCYLNYMSVGHKKVEGVWFSRVTSFFYFKSC